MSKWMIGSCVKQGLSHIDEGKVCQDHIACDTNESGTCMAAVLADGLGSRGHSELAARASTKAAVKWLLENSEWLCEAPDAAAVIRNQLLDRAKSSIRDVAREQMLDVEDLDCNLAFLCVQISRKKAIFGHLGDCAVCVLDGKPRVLTAQNGSAIGTNTVMSARPDEIQMEIIDLNEKVNGFILTSDGLDGEIYRKNSTFVRNAAKDYFNTVFEAEPNDALARKVQDLQNSRGSQFDDDISIVVVSQAKEPIDLPRDPLWLCRCGTRNPLTASYCTKCHADFLSLYPHGVINQFKSLDEAIVYLNAHPDEERAVLGLPPAPPAASAEKDTRKKRNKERQKEPRPAGDSRPDWAKAGDGEDPKPAPAEQREPVQSGRPGGSSAFVQQQARQKQEESQIDISLRGSETSGGSAHGAGQAAASEQQNPSGFDKFLNRWELPVLCAAAVIIVICMVLGRSGLFRGKDPGGESTGPAVQQTQPHETRPRETEGRQPQAEDNYVGEYRNGVPDGAGVLFEDGYFWVGTFVDGVKDGVFQKISARDTAKVEQVEFDMGRVVRNEEPTEPMETVKNPESENGLRWYVLTRDIQKLYDDDERTGNSIVDLFEGDRVLVDESRSFRDDGTKWVWIESEMGKGYCDASALEPLEEAGE